MRHLILFVFLLSAYGSRAQRQNGDNMLLADPTIFFHNGVYYLYGTGSGSKPNGFKVFTSVNKKNWESKGYALKEGESFGNKGFWAPQVFEYKGKFYMAYTANEHIAIAAADGPLGPFTQKKLKPVDAATRMIDPFIFFDSGKIYLYHVRLQEGNRIFVAELNDDLSAIKKETLKECINASDPWEDTQNAAWKVAEGPTVLKHKGLYYMVYSANDFRNPDYAIGYATAANPTGPWKKYAGSPVISRNNLGVNGPGHGDVVTDRNGKMFYVFHVHNSDTEVSPRKTAIIRIEFKEVAGYPDKITVRRSTFRLLKN
ncbi:glycoside hydrolase family 43 protein [Niabella aquatica]